MTLDEGIIHAEDVARSNHEAATYLADEHPTQAEKCEECAREHEQLAEWLKELKAYRSRSEIPNTCGDAISRQAAIEAIEALQRPIMREESNYYQFKFSGMSEAREAVENLPSVTPQRRTGEWIPVWERLPEERGVYLVTQKAIFPGHVFRRIVGYAPNLHDVDEYDFADKKRPGWYEYDSEWGYRELDDVIAWMPLVEPYKVESEEV